MDTTNEIPTAALPEQLKLLESHAANLAKENRHDDAERLYQEILKAAPYNMPGLRYLAARAVIRRDFVEAQRLVERAIKIAPRKPALHQNLAIILRAQDRLDEALQAFRATLGLNPQQPLSWIQQGDVLQALGRIDEAVASYNKAASIAGNLGVLANAHKNNPQALTIIGRAARSLVKEREKAIAHATRNIVNHNGRSKLERAMAAGQHMAQSKIPQYQDPLQRPAFCYFPDLDPKPFYERSNFPFLKDLEKNHKLIGKEFKNLLPDEKILHPYVKIDARDPAQWSELNYSLNWSSYHLYKNGKRVDENCKRCPETIKIVDSLPLVKIKNQAPEVFFSILKPGTHIPPHYGIANYKLAVHLPIMIPDSCGIRVGGITRNWKPGKCLIFDDSFEHEAWNTSNKLRAVLILEVWNPLIKDEEKLYLNEAVEGLESFRQRMDATTLTLFDQSS